MSVQIQLLRGDKMESRLLINISMKDINVISIIIPIIVNKY